MKTAKEKALRVAHNYTEITKAPSIIFAAEIAILVGKRLFNDGRFEPLIAEYEAALEESRGTEACTARIRTAIIRLGTEVSRNLDMLASLKPPLFNAMDTNKIPTQKAAFVRISTPNGHRFVSEVFQRGIEIWLDYEEKYHSRRQMTDIMFSTDKTDNAGQTSVQALADAAGSLNIIACHRDGESANAPLRYEMTEHGHELMLRVTERAAIYCAPHFTAIREKCKGFASSLPRFFRALRVSLGLAAAGVALTVALASIPDGAPFSVASAEGQAGSSGKVLEMQVASAEGQAGSSGKVLGMEA